MKTLYTSILLTILLLAGFNQQSKACYANFTHTNACVGDTVWFYALDLYAVHSWDFGDTTSGNPNTAYDDTVFHIYTTPGTYYVTHFDNIGAEWAFETQVITVSPSICFEAAFSANCAGALYFNFTNLSVGNNLTCQWTFGEPSSGSNDTSVLLNPLSHLYANPGFYTVTLIISDGTQSDTSVQTINVLSTCMSASFSYNLNPCANDTTHFYYYFSGVTNVLWNFGDPASGIANTSTDLAPTHIFTAPGFYIGYVIFTDGVNTDTLTVYTDVVDCNVFPGDANRNGRVEGEDILAIGLYYGDTGIVRSSASLNFTPQPCADWAGTSSAPIGNMYLQDFVPLKNADCNGDGIINDLDVQAVTQNFGMVSHPHNIESQMQMVPASAPHLRINILNPFQQVWGGGFADVSVTLGDSNSIVTGIYGFCITIQYNPLLVDGNSILVDFTNSWLDTIGQPNLISWYNNDEINGLLTIVSARKNHVSKTGYGEIANLHFGFNQATGWNFTMCNLTIKHDAKILSNGMFGNSGFIQNFLKVNLDDASVEVLWGGIHEISNNNNLTLFPSPANDKLFISSKENIRDAQLKVYDAAGKLLLENKMSGMNAAIYVTNFADGIYLLEVNDGVNVYRNKFVKQ